MRSLTFIFDTPISEVEIEYFRGAIISITQDDLFHNHTPNGKLRYSYPRVQYKRIHGKAAIVFVGEGVDIVGEVFSQGGFNFNLGNRTCSMRIEKVLPKDTDIVFLERPAKYRMRGWLALNGENYKKYSVLESMEEKTEMLQTILQTNILSFLKGVGIFVKERIKCSILDLEGPYMVEYKEAKLCSFNVVFSSNIKLPYFIGLGKGVSLGHGTITKYLNASHGPSSASEEDDGQ